MILTTCAACAAPLAHNAPRCVRCWTRYCDATCQHDHWRRGHKQMCKKIHRGGNAEQYNADKKYKEAVAVAVEACAEDTKGQTCFICTQALHWKTKEGLVRGCACRGTAGFAHVSCLVEQVKILLDEAEENNLGPEVLTERWHRWDTCSMCKQRYHGVVACALGWACWKTYLGRPEEHVFRSSAMQLLGNGLATAGRDEERLGVLEAELADDIRSNKPETVIVQTKGNIAICYGRLGRHEESQSILRECYTRLLKLAPSGELFFIFAQNLATSLNDTGRHKEATWITKRHLPQARCCLGAEHRITLKLRHMYALSLFVDDGASRDDIVKSLAILEELHANVLQIYGASNPFTNTTQRSLAEARSKLALFDARS